MAAGWLTALNLIPWKDVIEAAPGLARSAKGLFKRTQNGGSSSVDAAAAPPADHERGDGLPLAVQRLAALESRFAQAAELQKAADELLDSLASQNAVMVKAIDALDKRCQVLKVSLCLVGVVAVGALIWVAAIAR